MGELIRKTELEQLIRNLQTLMRCPSCGKTYRAEDIQFLGQVDLAYLLQLNCMACNLPVLATVVVSEGPNARKIISDLGVDEWMRFTPSEQLTTNDVLAMHQFLEAFDGNFERLFAGVTI